MLTVVMCLTYVGAFIGKMTTSINSLNCLFDYEVPAAGLKEGDIVYSNIYYPFKAGVVNITSVFWAVVFVSITRAYFEGRVAAYKTAAYAATLYSLTQYPGIIFLMTSYYTDNLDSLDVCNDFFDSGMYVTVLYRISVAMYCIVLYSYYSV